MKTERL